MSQTIDTTMFTNLHWRMIGPYRGGRTVGVAGIADQPNVFYIGVNDGGVWKTDDYGRTWKSVFDSEPTGSVGAIAVAPSDPNVIYVGSGEGLQRPDLSVGDGVFKSTDAGATWRFMGLADAQQIGAIIVDPRDENRLFVAVLGHPYGANTERGVFRSTDGGEHWDKVLYKDENTGAIALAFDPINTDIVYADLWAARQGPWENGQWQGKNSGLFKSTDGGTTWNQLGGGLPTAEQGLGRIGFSIAPSDPTRLYAMVDAGKLGGVYKSTDAGGTWSLVNSEGRIWGRGDDFAEVRVDPKDENTIYVANTSTYRSKDAGQNFTAIKGAPGGDDYHTIWINPKNPQIILLGCDQGATLTVNGGATWSSWYNQPTAQFYHVITDNQFPYNVYGSQQESGSVGIASRGMDGEVTFREWHPVGADEWSYVAPDPLHPNLIYGSKGARFDKLTEQLQNVGPEAIRSGKYRNLRTAPLMFSPADPHALYLGTNVLFKTTNGGDSWDVISPDLSREHPDVPDNIGIYRAPEMTSMKRRGVIYSLGLSPIDKNMIWAGTDDGLIHNSTDGGKHWKNVTPPALTSWSKVAGMDAGHFDKKTVYAAVNRMRLDDMHPHIYRTHDGGKTWTEIVHGLPDYGPVDCVREDPVCKGLLFAGTERAVFVSFDDGDYWMPIRLNMPASSIRDLVIHNSDVVVGTHGRSFWILDNITPLRQLTSMASHTESLLFTPDVAYRVRWNGNTDTPLPPEEPGGENPPDGAMIDYFLPRGTSSVELEITDKSGVVVRHFSSAGMPETIDSLTQAIPTYWIRPSTALSAVPGMHRFVWDMHYARPDSIPPSFPISATYRNTAPEPTGPWVVPGTYTIKLTVDGATSSKQLVVKMDPRVNATPAILQQQSDLSLQCYHGIEQTRAASRLVRSLEKQIADAAAKATDQSLKDTLKSLGNKVKTFNGDPVEGGVDVMYFTMESGDSVKETLGGLATKFLYLMTLLQSADAKPTQVQLKAVTNEAGMLTTMMSWWSKFEAGELASVNVKLKSAGMEELRTK
ncbi:MAG TPA: glycoside hydrolase [Bacteroidota bacterium]|nr:glycoside hydrolase [Bacteroidota bacterium]